MFAQSELWSLLSAAAQSITIIKVMMIRYEIGNVPSGAVTRFGAPDAVVDTNTGELAAIVSMKLDHPNVVKSS